MTSPYQAKALARPIGKF